tara:strand:- start:79 stop:477 length:399 start_codon:yes stop_codon:yes gene_type:complete
MINKVILVGRLGADPEINTTSTGSKFANLSLATNKSWKNKQGEKQEQTTWHKVKVFDPNLATNVENYARTGTQLYVEGELENRSYKDSKGNQRYVTEVLVPRFSGVIRLVGASKPAAKAEGQKDDTNFDNQF